MATDYYNKIIYIPQVDGQDKLIGPVERWKAHEEGILHRAFTIAVFFDGKILCQHRKHPVFNDVFDFTASSHPVMNHDKPQEIPEAISQTLEREWGMKQNDIKNLKTLGHAVYDDKDPKSKYREHEYCYLYTCETNKLPVPNLEMAYGFSAVTIDELKNAEFSVSQSLSPWIKEFFKKGLL